MVPPWRRSAVNWQTEDACYKLVDAETESCWRSLAVPPSTVHVRSIYRRARKHLELVAMRRLNEYRREMFSRMCIGPTVSRCECECACRPVWFIRTTLAITASRLHLYRFWRQRPVFEKQAEFLSFTFLLTYLVVLFRFCFALSEKRLFSILYFS